MSGTEPPERRRILRLDEATVRQIAAGEVVERPASVVKELVENSIDADAGEIRVRVDGGGIGMIEVSDNGRGIPVEDFPLVFERHATSKIKSMADLDCVKTLGFRGEALASIASVAKVRIVSRVSGFASAFEMEVLPGEPLPPPRETARSVGTSVTVRELFFNTPARRKFLKPAPSEALRISELLERTYLAHPSNTIVEVSGDVEKARYSATKSLTEAAVNVFGVEFLQKSFKFSGTGGPGIWLEGIASHPSLTRGTSGRIVMAVNGRAITSKPLIEALRAAYLDVIPKGKYPIAVLHMSVDEGVVDVNVHPSKREVRFQWEDELRSSIRALVASNLRSAPRSSSVSLPRPTIASSMPLPPPVPGSTQQQLGLVKEAGLDMKEKLTIPGTPYHPQIILLGQVGALYIVGEIVDGSGVLVLVDAHAASERMIYEGIMATALPAHQELLVPAEIELTPRQADVLKSLKDEIASMGFSVEHFGGRTYRIHAVPSFLWHRVEPERLSGVLDELSEGELMNAKSSLHERVAKTVACHLAIRGGDPLTTEEMERLLKELYSTRESFTCPHGRPIMVTLKREDLDKWFHRPSS